MDVEIRGGEGLALVAKAVRRLGSDRTIVNNMGKEIRSAVPPVRDSVRRSAVATLPSGGGLGAWVAKSRVTTRVRRSANAAGVTIVAGRNSRGGRSDIKRMNDGRLRAPAWGNRKAWHTQSVTPGFFDKGVEAELDGFRTAVVRAVDNAVEEVLGRG